MAQTIDIELVSNEVRLGIEQLLKDLDIEKYNLDISQGSIKGDNYLGIVAKVQVQGEDKNGRSKMLNLIVKSAPRNELLRSLIPIPKLYGREIYLYRKILPELKKFQEERGILKPFISIAKCYKTAMEEMNEVLIMENMKELGYELQDRQHGLDYNHVLLVLREYGRLHALSYALRDQKPELFKEFCTNMEEIFLHDWGKNESTKAAVDGYGDRALNTLDPVKHKVAYEKFNNFKEHMLETAQKLVKPEPAGRYAVFNHGDCWVNNLLFKYGNPAKPHTPSDLCILDWQLSRLGSPALDLVHFIFTCTEKELRDQHYDNLIQEYYNSLSGFLRELGSDPEKLLPFEVLQEHLKKFGLYGLFMAVMMIHLTSSDSDEIPDINTLDDEAEAMDKFQYETKNIEKYNSRMSGVILDIVQYGYNL